MPFKEFIDSLNSRAEGVSLQAIADSFRNLHQILRSGGDTEARAQRKGTVTGEHKFFFEVHFEPRSEVVGLCQSGVLVASATTTKDSNDVVPVTYRWQRKVGVQLVPISGAHSSMYHLSADDVGAHIFCQAEPIGNPALGGIATGVLGPFSVDPIAKMQVENIFHAAGCPTIPARHVRDSSDRHPRDLQIKVEQDGVKVLHPGAERGQGEVHAPYTADYPRVLISSSGPMGFRLELSEDPDQAYTFEALSRTQRDLIAMLIRIYHARHYVATSFVLSRLFQDPATPGAPLTSVEAQDFDVNTLDGRLSRELDRTVGQLEVLDRVVRNANFEKRELQAQLRETIASYTEAIEKLHAQLATAQGGPTANLQLKLHESRSMQSKLQLELQELRSQASDLGQHLPAGEAGAEGELQALKAETKELRAAISSFAGDQHDQSKRDARRKEDEGRLRKDVESLSREKDALEANVVQAEKEKAELVENFMYVKENLDQLQMQSLSTPAASPEHEREVAQLKAAYSQVSEERSRLAQKVDAMDRERERQKHQREGALERVMSANARLLEERDKMEKERLRLSELYERTVSALGVVPKASAVASAAAAGAGADDEDVDGPCDQAAFNALMAELESTSRDLTKAEQEGDALRHRLRRLALA